MDLMTAFAAPNSSPADPQRASEHDPTAREKSNFALNYSLRLRAHAATVIVNFRYVSTIDSGFDRRLSMLPVSNSVAAFAESRQRLRSLDTRFRVSTPASANAASSVCRSLGFSGNACSASAWSAPRFARRIGGARPILCRAHSKRISTFHDVLCLRSHQPGKNVFNRLRVLG